MREIVIHCDNVDIHGDERVPAEARRFRVDTPGELREVDLCDSCNENLLGPLRRILESAGKRQPRPAQPPSPRTSKPQQMYAHMCFGCEAGPFGSSTALNGHSTVEHGITVAEMLGTTCPLDNRSFGSYQALSLHFAGGHHLSSVPNAFIHLRVSGRDEFGIVKLAETRLRRAEAKLTA